MSGTFLAIRAVFALHDGRFWRILAGVVFLVLAGIPWADVSGGIYHALNRGNAKNPIFFKDEDYEAFERIVAEGLERYAVA